jgi:uncharacterized OB-fold protein
VVEAFTVGYVGPEGQPLPEPVAVGLIRLDGADTVLLHFLLEADRLSIGQRVEPDLLARSKRTGSILDIHGFRAVGA